MFRQDDHYTVKVFEQTLRVRIISPLSNAAYKIGIKRFRAEQTRDFILTKRIVLEQLQY